MRGVSTVLFAVPTRAPKSKEKKAMQQIPLYAFFEYVLTMNVSFCTSFAYVYTKDVYTQLKNLRNVPPFFWFLWNICAKKRKFPDFKLFVKNYLSFPSEFEKSFWSNLYITPDIHKRMQGKRLKLNYSLQINDLYKWRALQTARF